MRLFVSQRRYVRGESRAAVIAEGCVFGILRAASRAVNRHGVIVARIRTGFPPIAVSARTPEETPSREVRAIPPM